MERQAQRSRRARSLSAATPALSAVARSSSDLADDVALDGVSLDVREGECVALVGESGSGKTTLLRSFNGLVTPDCGRSAIVAGRDIAIVDVIELRRVASATSRRTAACCRTGASGETWSSCFGCGSRRDSRRACRTNHLRLVGSRPRRFSRRDGRASSRAVSDSELRSRALSRRAHAFCFSTSHSERSMPSHGPTFRRASPRSARRRRGGPMTCCARHA